MAKKWYIALLAVLILVGVIVAVYYLQTQSVGTFQLDDYAYFLSRFPSDEVFGPIDDADRAKEVAEILWAKTYGEYIQEEKPYYVSYDSENAVWLVSGSASEGLFANTKGGTTNLLVRRSDGQVLAVWHEE